MVDTSVQYNLTNPAFTDDIGLSNLHTMLPMAPATFGGSGGFIPGVKCIQNLFQKIKTKIKK